MRPWSPWWPTNSLLRSRGYFCYKKKRFTKSRYTSQERRDVSTSLMAASVTENGRVSGNDGSEWYEKYSYPEDIPGLDLSNSLSVSVLLDKVKDLLKGKPDLLQRQFRDVKSKGDASTNGVGAGDSIRIMQWNILADALSTGKDNFVRCPMAALEWSTRRLYILQEILSVDPDVLTMQEVDHYGFFKHILVKCGYAGAFYPKPDSPTLYVKNNNGPDGCAMFYRNEKVKLLNEEKIILKTMPGNSETNQVSIIMDFEVRDTGKQFTVATTHLKAKAGWEQLRHLQGSYLAKHLEQQTGDKPLILCGDFNAEYDEKVYTVFLKSSLGLASAYREADSTGTEPSYTTWKIRGSSDGKSEKESKRTIDYIWYTRNKTTLREILDLPTPEQIGENRLPSQSYPSDHLSLAASFVLN